MSTALTVPTPSVEVSPRTTARGRPIVQFSRRGIYLIWAAATIPMVVLSWIVAPALANGSDIESMMGPLLGCLAVGLMFQFVLAVGLVAHEQRTLRPSILKDAMWLRSPRSPKTGRVGGRTWFVLVPLIVAFVFTTEAGLPAPAGRDLAGFLQSDAGATFFHGAWGMFGLFLVMAVFNTVLGEELLFRGVLLPRMEGAFGKRDWVANGLLFAIYHLHVPWAITNSILDGILMAWATKRYRSAWIGIAVHSAQTVVIGLVILALVV
jgi:membrane protease YdiL (CAAX protease family)